MRWWVAGRELVVPDEVVALNSGQVVVEYRFSADHIKTIAREASAVGHQQLLGPALGNLDIGGNAEGLVLDSSRSIAYAGGTPPSDRRRCRPCSHPRAVSAPPRILGAPCGGLTSCGKSSLESAAFRPMCPLNSGAGRGRTSCAVTCNTAKNEAEATAQRQIHEAGESHSHQSSPFS